MNVLINLEARSYFSPCVTLMETSVTRLACRSWDSAASSTSGDVNTDQVFWTCVEGVKIVARQDRRLHASLWTESLKSTRVYSLLRLTQTELSVSCSESPYAKPETKQHTHSFLIYYERENERDMVRLASAFLRTSWPLCNAVFIVYAAPLLNTNR